MAMTSRSQFSITPRRLTLSAVLEEARGRRANGTNNGASKVESRFAVGWGDCLRSNTTRACPREPSHAAGQGKTLQELLRLC